MISASKGPKFTWAGVRAGGAKIRCMLDRVLANSAAQNLFPWSEVVVQNGLLSDHCALVLQCWTEQVGVKESRPFRFESMWLRHSDLQRVVAKYWNETPNSVVTITQHTRNLQAGLRRWNKEVFGFLDARMRRINGRLQTISTQQPSDDNYAQMKALKAELAELDARRQIMWKQRSTADWLQEGDHNTRFFHSFASKRRRINRID